MRRLVFVFVVLAMAGTTVWWATSATRETAALNPPLAPRPVDAPLEDEPGPQERHDARRAPEVVDNAAPVVAKATMARDMDVQRAEDLLRMVEQQEERLFQRELERRFEGLDQEQIAAALLAGLESSDESVAIESARALSVLDQPVRTHAFLDVLRSSPLFLVQRDLANHLCQRGPPEVRAQLAEMAFDPSLEAERRANVIGALIESSSPDGIDALVARAQSSPDPAARATLLQAGAYESDEDKQRKMLPLVTRALTSPDPAELGVALDFLSRTTAASEAIALQLEGQLVGRSSSPRRLRIERTLTIVRERLEAAKNPAGDSER